MKWESHDFTVGANFLPALINGDYTGLSDAEEAELDAFLDDERFTGVSGHWADTSVGSDDFFGRCDISNWKRSVYMVSFVFPVN